MSVRREYVCDLSEANVLYDTGMQKRSYDVNFYRFIIYQNPNGPYYFVVRDIYKGERPFLGLFGKRRFRCCNKSVEFTSRYPEACADWLWRYPALKKPIDDPKVMKAPTITVKDIVNRNTKSNEIDEPTEKLTAKWENSNKLQKVRTIMGKNFLGVREVIRYLGVNFTEKDLYRLGNIPWSEKTLQQLKDTHVLFVGYPLAIGDIYPDVPSDLEWSFDGGLGYDINHFMKDEKVDLRWYLIRKDPVPESVNKTHRDGLSFLGKENKVPWAREMVYMLVLYYKVRGIRLLEKSGVRCQDLDVFGRRAHVGPFVNEELCMMFWWDDRPQTVGGVASSRKLTT